MKCLYTIKSTKFYKEVEKVCKTKNLELKTIRIIFQGLTYYVGFRININPSKSIEVIPCRYSYKFDVKITDYNRINFEDYEKTYTVKFNEMKNLVMNNIKDN